MYITQIGYQPKSFIHNKPKAYNPQFKGEVNNEVIERIVKRGCDQMLKLTIEANERDIKVSTKELQEIQNQHLSIIKTLIQFMKKCDDSFRLDECSIEIDWNKVKNTIKEMINNKTVNDDNFNEVRNKLLNRYKIFEMSFLHTPTYHRNKMSLPFEVQNDNEIINIKNALNKITPEDITNSFINQLIRDAKASIKSGYMELDWIHQKDPKPDNMYNDAGNFCQASYNDILKQIKSIAEIMKNKDEILARIYKDLKDCYDNLIENDKIYRQHAENFGKESSKLRQSNSL